MKDYLIRGIDESGNIRIFVANTTNLVEDARKTHNTNATGSAALGRALTAGELMGTMLKNDEDVLTLSINGNGPAKGLHVVSKNDGNVKGYLIDPTVDVPNKPNGKLDVGGLIGNEGILTVIMDLGLKEPYIGKSKLVTGEIAEDIANYYAISEQQPSAVSLGVLVDVDYSIKAAGGYILQLLPGVKDEDIDKIEDNLRNAKTVSEYISEGLSPEQIMDEILRGFNPKVLETKELFYKCDCSRERTEKALISLGEKEIRDIIEEDQGAELVCHFCDSKYEFTKEDLEEIVLTINQN